MLRLRLAAISRPIAMRSACVLITAALTVAAIFVSPLAGAEKGLTAMTVSPPTLVAGHADEPIKIDGGIVGGGLAGGRARG